MAVLDCQQALDVNPSEANLLELNSAKSSLQNWLKAESVLWKQRSKVRWLLDGDRNTKFFHHSAKSRGTVNRIDRISVGNSSFTEGGLIREQAVGYFSNLMQATPIIPSESLFQVMGPSVSADQNSTLIAVPTSTEVRQAVFKLKSNSSPGPDDFSGIFFTKCWSIVGQDVISAVIHFFKARKLLRATNAYFLTLIPKKHSPDTFADFRPISLLNFTYKVISKILATRLSAIIPFLISTHQAAFVKGRSIHHQVALAHDLFQKLNTKVSGGAVCLKLDITKAFDKLQWNFIFRALQFFNFSP